MIPVGAEYCAECGAPAVDDFGEGSESAVYPELARANLLRMRGEYKQAEDICLTILRRHPNSATANTLLGDISAERGDLKQAAEWYEMALDITPDSESDRSKLAGIRSRIKDHEAATTAKQLGLPESRPKIGLWIGSVVVFVVLVATVAYLLGGRTSSRASAPLEITAPVSVPPIAGRQTPDPETVEETPTPPPPSELIEQIKATAADDASRIVGATRFPENLGILLTVTVSPGEDARQIAVRLARFTLPTVADAPSVTVIGIREGRPAYIGTMTRDRFNLAASEDWKAQNGDDLVAYANATMVEEWMPAPTTAVPADPP